MSEEAHDGGRKSCLPDTGCGGTVCRLCGEALPLPEDAARGVAGSAPPSSAGTSFVLVDCPGCGAQQVRTLGAPICGGESLALQNALAYLARRRRDPSPP